MFEARRSSDKTVKVWDISARASLHTFTNHTDQVGGVTCQLAFIVQVWGVAFDSTGKRLASVSDDKSIIIYDTPI